MSYKFIKPRAGFTLVELLIVVAIMLIMTGTLFANQRNKKEVIEVESAAREVAAQLRALQNEALNGKLIEGEYAHYFKFNTPDALTSNNSVYTVSYANSAGPSNIIGDVQPFNLAKKHVVFSPASLYFTSPLGKPDSWRLITITSTTSSSDRMYVCISSSGNITEQKNANCS